MKAPNGYGQVNHLKGKRRKPWQVRITVGYKPNERGSLTPIYKNIGYYRTRSEAFSARDEYNRQLAIANGTDVALTVGEVYGMWKEEHFQSISPTTVGQYESAFKHVAEIRDLPIRDVTFNQLQDIVNTGASFPAKKNIKVVLNQMWKFALVRDYVVKDIATGLNIGKQAESNLHFSFNSSEILKLWQNRNDYTEFTLCLIYTGMRPGELIATLQSNVADGAIYVPGGKTVNAQRYVPIHPDIAAIIEDRLNGGYMLFTFDGHAYDFPRQRTTFIRRWEKAMTDAGVLMYEHPTAGLQPHKPHDGRHTFTSFWKSQKLDEGMRRYIQGHAGQGTGERVYTHYDLGALSAELANLNFL